MTLENPVGKYLYECIGCKNQVTETNPIDSSEYSATPCFQCMMKMQKVTEGNKK